MKGEALTQQEVRRMVVCPSYDCLTARGTDVCVCVRVSRAWCKQLQVSLLQGRVSRKDDLDMLMNVWEPWQHMTSTRQVHITRAFLATRDSHTRRINRLRAGMCVWARVVYCQATAQNAAKVPRTHTHTHTHTHTYSYLIATVASFSGLHAACSEK